MVSHLHLLLKLVTTSHQALENPPSQTSALTCQNSHLVPCTIILWDLLSLMNKYVLYISHSDTLLIIVHWCLLIQAINVIECPEFRRLLLLLRSDLKDSNIPHRTKTRELILEAWRDYFVVLKADLKVSCMLGFESLIGWIMVSTASCQ